MPSGALCAAAHRAYPGNCPNCLHGNRFLVSCCPKSDCTKAGNQMKKVGDFYSMGRIWSMALLLSVVAVVAAGCGGGGRDPILGSGGATTAIAPTVTATVP